jgi:hypothetical protein
MKHLLLALPLLLLTACGKKVLQQENDDLWEQSVRQSSEIQMCLADQQTLKIENTRIREQVAKFSTENESLLDENTRLKQQLDELLNGASKLLAKAKIAFENNNYEEAQQFLHALEERHPESDEYRSSLRLRNRNSEKLREQRLEQEKEAEAELNRQTTERALQNLLKDHDEFKQITWFKHKDQRILGTQVRLYFGQTDSGELLPLRLKAQYEGSSWIFARRIIAIADGELLPPISFQFDRENGSGKVWESIDEGVTTTTLRNLVEKIASSETVKLRFEGDGVRDFEVPEWQLVQFREMLAAYQATNESHSP